MLSKATALAKHTLGGGRHKKRPAPTGAKYGLGEDSDDDDVDKKPALKKEDTEGSLTHEGLLGDILSLTKDRGERDWATKNQHRIVAFEPETYFRGAHGSAAYWVCFSKGGKYMATCGHDRTAVLWHIRSPTRTFTRLAEHKEAVTQCCFSPDEKYLLCASGMDLKIYWCESGILRHSIRGHDDTITGVDWSPDQQVFASCSHDAHVRFWGFHRALKMGKSSGTESLMADLFNRKCRHEEQVYRVVFAHKGPSALTCSKDKTVKLWNGSREHVMDFTGHEGPVLGVAWSSDDSRFASCSQDSTVNVYRPEDPAPLFRLRGHEGVVYAVAWCPVSTARRGRLVSCGQDQQLIFWDYRKGRVRRRLPSGAPQGWTMCVTFHPGGVKLATCSTESDVSALIWGRYAPLRDVYQWFASRWNAVWVDNVVH